MRLLLRRGERLLGRVTVGGQLAPLADAVLDAARSTGAQVVLTRHAAVAELVPRVDEVLDGNRSLAAEVRRLQAAGHAVLVVSQTDDEALAAADVGAAVQRDGRAGGAAERGAEQGAERADNSADRADKSADRADSNAERAENSAEQAENSTEEANISTERAENGAERANGGKPDLGGDGCVCWSAHLLCGPGLEDVWRVLRAVAAARAVSQRAVRLAKSGSALSGLLAVVGKRRAGRRPGLTPVYGAALLALIQGTAAGLTVTRQPVPPPVAHVPWHALDQSQVLARLAEARDDAARPPPVGWLRATPTRIRGLADRVAGLPPGRISLRLASAVREELQDPMTPVLAVGAAASAIVGSSIDAVLVAAVMAGNALISGTQRIRAERALRQLFVDHETTARRLPRCSADAADADVVAGLDSVPLVTVPASDLCPGDIIALRASDVVPADARLLSTVDLEVDESTLTGESRPVDKGFRATPAAPLAERTCMVFDGTTVLAGTAYAVVVATGEATEAGRATRAAGRAGAAAGLQARLGEVTRKALPATLLGGATVTGLATLRRLPLRQAVAAGVSVAVAAVPEGLPLVATVAEAAAARRLSRRGVLVVSSRTLEALGRVDVLCFDKTGTLTEGRLAVSRLASATGDLEPDDPAARR